MGIGLGEFVIILLVSFVIVGPEDLPKVARTLARWIRTAKRSLKELGSTLDEDLHKEELAAAGTRLSNHVRKADLELERVQKQVLASAQKGQ